MTGFPPRESKPLARVILRQEEVVTQEVPVGAGTNMRFVANPKDRASLVVLAGPTPGAMATLEGDELIMGRGEEAHMCIEDAGLSRMHARVFRQDDGYYVEDLKSKNGTFVDGKPVRSARRLNEGDRILIGRDTVLKFSLQDVFEQEAARRLYESAVRDPLTQIYNRRYVDERLKGEFAFALRHGTPLSVLMVDIDKFKQVNDTWGHPTGDEVLRVVAATIQRTIRTEDLVARYGGEEFIVIARSTDASNAVVLGERIRRVVQKVSIMHEQHTLQVTISVGVSTRTMDKPYPTLEALVSAADQALYTAKEDGRNRVHMV